MGEHNRPLTRKELAERLEQFSAELGHMIGSIAPALAQFPPISKDASRQTLAAIQEVFDSAAAHGAPAHASRFYQALIDAVGHYAGHQKH